MRTFPDMGKRIESLDYLRGLLACAVMVYHYTAWSMGPLPVETVLGRLGVYAVAAFYVLSGLSLGIVYRIESRADVASFAVKRFFRIAPLFWIVVTLGIWLSGKFDAREAVLNYTLTFGFIDPTAYFTTGAWSIGNEVVFYALFPLILLRVRVWMAASLAVGAYFAFLVLTPGFSLSDQWAGYVNPLNNLFLFVAGVAMSRGDWMRWPRAALVGVLAASAAVFCLWPMQGNSIQQVTGLNRFVMSGACIAFVLALYRLAPVFKGWLAEGLAFLGRGSYSIYLMHPIVVVFFVHNRGTGEVAGYVVAAICTLMVSALTYRYLELPMMRLGKRATAYPILKTLA